MNKTYYYILSGEGELGTWTRVLATERGIKARLKKERCGGDRKASAFTVEDVGETLALMSDIETGRTRLVSSEVIGLFKENQKEKGEVKWQ